MSMSSCNFLYQASEALWVIDAEITTKTLCQQNIVYMKILCLAIYCCCCRSMSSCNFLYQASEALCVIDAEIITKTLCQQNIVSTKHCVHENKMLRKSIFVAAEDL